MTDWLTWKVSFTVLCSVTSKSGRVHEATNNCTHDILGSDRTLHGYCDLHHTNISYIEWAAVEIRNFQAQGD